MAMHNLTVRVNKIRVLSKQKPTMKRQILEEENYKIKDSEQSIDI
jgi:hypothetical protein